ncbi:MAG: hypothetical protein ABSA75_01895 [Candidatus Bathyarchaeia archaeon]|jgi:hypothetical protein
MWKRIIKNRKGTAEVIGTIMFIVILMFFFTNVYLWHDAATKEMNNMYVEKINTPITVSLTSDPSTLNVTNKGGTDSQLTMLWIDIKSPSGSGPDVVHLNFNLISFNYNVPAGSSIMIPSHYDNSYGSVTFKVVTTLGNPAACSYP